HRGRRPPSSRSRLSTRPPRASSPRRRTYSGRAGRPRRSSQLSKSGGASCRKYTSNNCFYLALLPTARQPARGSETPLPLKDRQHLRGVTGGLDVRKNLLDVAIGADHERRTRNAHHFFAVHVLFLQDTVSGRGLLLHVAQQRERQAMLEFEA